MRLESDSVAHPVYGSPAADIGAGPSRSPSRTEMVLLADALVHSVAFWHQQALLPLAGFSVHRTTLGWTTEIAPNSNSRLLVH
jgi:hypothetical protein